MTTRNEMEALLDAIQGGGKVVGEPAMSTVRAIRAALAERDDLKAQKDATQAKLDKANEYISATALDRALDRARVERAEARLADFVRRAREIEDSAGEDDEPEDRQMRDGKRLALIRDLAAEKGGAMSAKSLPAFSVRFDKKAHCWEAVDRYTGVASQGQTRRSSQANLIEALRLVVKTYDCALIEAEARLAEVKRRAREIWEHREQSDEVNALINSLIRDLAAEENKAEISNCCRAFVAVGGKGVTHYYICSKCGNPCDAAGKEDR